MCSVNGEVGWGPPSYLQKYSEVMETEESDQSEDDTADQKGNFLSHTRGATGVKWSVLVSTI